MKLLLQILLLFSFHFSQSNGTSIASNEISNHMYSQNQTHNSSLFQYLPNFMLQWFRITPTNYIINSNNGNSTNILNELDQQIYHLYPNNEPSINLKHNLPSLNSAKKSSIFPSKSSQIEPDITYAIIVKEPIGYLQPEPKKDIDEGIQDVAICCGSQIISKKDLPKNIVKDDEHIDYCICCCL